MLFENLQREKVSKREGYLCFFLSRLSKFSGTSNGQPDVKDFKASSMGEELSAPSEPG
jgi:hypothetical protein